jgi:DNA-binding response OmpR family regulator
MRLLLIEDNEKLALNTSASLRENGFAVDVLHNGEDALDAVRNFDYDAIILDLGLPDIDGFDLLERFKHMRGETPVIICTARDALDERLRGLNSGSDDYVVKPFAFAELLARIRAVLRRPGRALGTELACGNLRFSTVDRTVSIDGRPVLGARDGAAGAVPDPAGAGSVQGGDRKRALRL